MSTPVPVTRRLSAVLRRELEAAAGQNTRLLVATVVARVGTTKVTVDFGGGAPQVTIPRLDGYNAQPGEIAYVLSSGSFIVAIGTVK